MKKIKLTREQYAIVDDENYRELNRYKWHARYDLHSASYYATRHKEQIMVQMHRIILNAPRGIQVDHINHNTLDNRIENLRMCTNSQNHMNRKPHKNTTSKYKGVCLPQNKKWVAQIHVNKKQVHLGYFELEIQAAKAYNKAARKYFGKFALLNEV